MKTSHFLSMMLVIAGILLCTAPVMAEPAPGATGILWFTSNVGGASVFIDGNLVGTIPEGDDFEIAYEPSFSTYTVSKNGYTDVSGPINYVPGGSGNLHIPVTLSLIPGGNGWIDVLASDGATVYFDGVPQGTTSGGLLSVSIPSTATPITTITVSKAGYVTWTGQVPHMPAVNEHVSVVATLNPVPTTTIPTTVPTVAPSYTIGGDTGVIIIHTNIDGASVFFDNTFKGITSGKNLRVAVFTTGTPYTTYRVEKVGYITETGALPLPPAKDATKDVYVNLNPEPAPTTQEPIGGSQGFFVVHSNVDGAVVMFGTDRKGVISNGILSVPYYTTGTPYQTFTVSKPGYTTFSGTFTRYPGKGESVDVHATLNPAAPTTAPTAIPTAKSPLPAWIPGLALVSVIGLAAFRNRK